jgi:hypothetical protein
MKRFVIVVSMLVFGIAAPASGYTARASGHAAPRNDYWWHGGCRWFCWVHEQPTAVEEEANAEPKPQETPPPEASNEPRSEPSEEPQSEALVEPPHGTSEQEQAEQEQEQAEQEQERAEQEEERPPLAESPESIQPPVEASPRAQSTQETTSERMWVGVNGGGWGPSEPREMAPMVKYVRLESGNTSEFGSFQKSGIRVDWDDWGPYGNGVSSINDAAYASHLVSVIEADPNIVSVEILNEPDGDWFWGDEASSKANAEAYARLLEVVYKKVKAKFGREHPLLLAAFEEGSTWGEVWWNALKDKSAVDGVVVHPYGGRGNRKQSALGNRGQVERAYAYTSKPVYVTEVGWPTAVKFAATADSLQWTQPEQAQNIYSFVNWARSTGYVGGVFIYGYHDAESNGPAEYGVVTHAGVKKSSWTALKEASESVLCTVCS